MNKIPARKLKGIANLSHNFSQRRLNRPTSSTTYICMLLSIAVTLAGYSAERPQTTIRSEVTGWMKNHPVMGTRARTITKIQNHPDATTPGAISVLSLSPTGTVVVNRDTRLPMIAIFTADTTVQDLHVFDVQVAHAAEVLKTLGTTETDTGVASYTPDDIYVPALLQTEWGQWAPYNSYLPVNPKMNGPAVTGCGTIAMAQILNHYQWPPYGEGARTHKDTAGKFNPTFTSNFEHAYRWNLMKNSFDSNVDSPASKTVAQLVYDMAVIGNIDCETNVSGVNLDLTGNNLASYLFYDKENLVIGDAISRQTIEENLLNGIPVPADITINTNGDGHAIIFDGLLVRNGTTSYHTNYGWYGSHNFWWDKDAILAVWQAKPGIRPALIPLPANRNLVAKQGQPLRLPWKIAAQRKAEASKLNLYQEVLKNGTWMEDCESLPATADTRSWSLDGESISGNCWKANSPYPADYLTIVDSFIPTKNAVIEFQEKHKCVNNHVDIEASVDGGEFKPIFTVGKEIRTTWQTQRVSLASFAGKPVKLRLGYHAPPFSAYYSSEQGGGIWIDNLRVTNTLVKSWNLVDTIAGDAIQTINGQDSITTHPTLKNLALGIYNFSASLTDATNVERRAGSDFTLTVTRTGMALEKFEVLDQNKSIAFGTYLKIGSTKVDKQTVKQVLIQNTGTTTIRGIQIKSTGTGRNDFTTTLGKSTLAPGEKTILKIQFKPSKAGLRKMDTNISTSANTSLRLRVIGRGKE